MSPRDNNLLNKESCCHPAPRSRPVRPDQVMCCGILKGNSDSQLNPRRGSCEFEFWDNWYDYEGTYWAPGQGKKGVDLGEPSRWVYAFHAILGHHGVVSLSPIWLFSLGGAWTWLRRGDKLQRGFALAVVMLTAVCLIFYIGMRPLEDRNYGGVSCCFRWTLWLVPLWLISLLPCLDAIADRPRMRWLAGSLYC